MLKRTLIVLPLTFALVLSVQPLQSVHGVLMTEAELVMIETNDASARQYNTDQKREGNSFIRALKAPFRALGRLFGGGKKNENKLQRLTEKDIANFESTPADPVKSTSVKARAQAKHSNNPGEIQTDHLSQGRELLNSGQLNEAIAELSKAASINPALAEPHNLLGVAYEHKGLRDRAMKSFETAVRLNHDDPEALNNLGYLLFKNGEFGSATKYLKRAAKRAADNPRIWNNLGMAQSERRHFNDAYRSFARAVGEFRGHLNVATRLEAVGETKDAIKHLEKARAIRPNSTEVLARLIPLYESSGNESQAHNARSSLVTLRTLADATSN